MIEFKFCFDMYDEQGYNLIANKCLFCGYFFNFFQKIYTVQFKGVK